MIRPHNLPTSAGSFILANTKAGVAYVGYGKNLRGRFTTWDYHFKRAEADPSYTLPARDMPRTPADDWKFVFLIGEHEDDLRKVCEKQGLRILNEHARKRTTIVVQGIEASLLQHARRLGRDHNVVYKRVNRGQTPEQALGLTSVPALELRDYAIQSMRVKILSDGGGWLTYDEAVQMRPELGDVRSKLTKFRRKNPDAGEVKLSDIPV